MDKYTQRDSFGNIDHAASTKAHAEALKVWETKNEIPVDGIASVVNGILDNASPDRVVIPTVVSMAATALGATSATHAAISERVRNYVQGQVKAGKLFVKLGSGGGLGFEPAVKSDKQA